MPKKSLGRFKGVASEPERNVPTSQIPLRQKALEKKLPLCHGTTTVNRNAGRAGVGGECLRVPA